MIAFGDPTARAAAVQEIMTAAESTGLSWGKKLLGDLGAQAAQWLTSAPSSDVARYLALARISIAAIAKFGADKLNQPGTHSTLEFVIVAALKAINLLAPQQTTGTDQAPA